MQRRFREHTDLPVAFISRDLAGEMQAAEVMKYIDNPVRFYHANLAAWFTPLLLEISVALEQGKCVVSNVGGYDFWVAVTQCILCPQQWSRLHRVHHERVVPGQIKEDLEMDAPMYQLSLPPEHRVVDLHALQHHPAGPNAPFCGYFSGTGQHKPDFLVGTMRERIELSVAKAIEYFSSAEEEEAINVA